MDPSEHSPQPIHVHVSLHTPERTSHKKYDFTLLEVIQTPLSTTSNIFSRLLQPPQNPFSVFIYQTPKKPQTHQVMKQEISPFSTQKKETIIIRPRDNNLRKRSTYKYHSGPKPCNCQKSNCLKRYCDCFKLGIGCSQSCKCYDCKNQQQPTKQSLTKIHCNCRKSECAKNYCECHSAGIKCSTICGCIQCKNQPGRKDTVKKRGKVNLS